MLVKNDQRVVWTPASIRETLDNMEAEELREAGRRVATLRRAKRWSQEDLAHEAGVSTQTVSRVERGAVDGRSGTWRALADALGVDEPSLTGPALDPFGLNERADAAARLERIEDAVHLIAERQNTILKRLDEIEAARAQPLPAPPGPPAKPQAVPPKRAAQGRRHS